MIMLPVKLWGGKLWYQVKLTSYELSDYKDTLIEYCIYYTLLKKSMINSANQEVKQDKEAFVNEWF